MAGSQADLGAPPWATVTSVSKSSVTGLTSDPVKRGIGERLSLLVVRLAALAWLVQAAYGRLVIHRAAVYGTVPEGAPQVVGLFLLPLALAWAVVLILSFAPGRGRLSGLRLAQAAATGGVAMGALLLPSVLWPKAGATGSVMALFGLSSAAVQALGLAGAIHAERTLPGATVRSWRSVVIVGFGAVLSFALNALVQSQRACNLGESMARGELRIVASAEAAYQSSAGGAYGPPRCLQEPTTCLPGYPPNGPPFLDAYALRPSKCGYRYEFHPGPRRADPEGRRDTLGGYAVTAIPVAPPGTGPKALCIDDSGTLRSSRTGRLPPIVGGRCPEELDVES